MSTQAFLKMHGLGNDFVVLDGRPAPISLTPGQVCAVADRQTGIGCDQLIVMEPPRSDRANVFMRIFNADGSEVAACGNATRCVASLVMEETGSDQVIVETAAGLLDAQAAVGGQIAVGMGRVRLDWRDIPLAEPRDTLHLGLGSGPLQDPVGVNVGNPHAVFFVDDVEAVDLAVHGPKLETDALFPEFANIEAVQVLSGSLLRMRAWERGAGITKACGTGACAALVAAHRRGLTGRKAEVVLDGGTLFIEWLPDDHVLMTGPVATSFKGELSL